MKFLFIFVLFFVKVFAMNVIPQEEMNFKSKNNLSNLKILKNGSVTFSINGKSIDWTNKVSLPSKVYISELTNKAYLLGGYGDSGTSLGIIYVYESNGNLINKIDLKETIRNLEKMSREGSPFTNFPWISQFEMQVDTQILKVLVCDKVEVKISQNGELIK